MGVLQMGIPTVPTVPMLGRPAQALTLARESLPLPLSQSSGGASRPKAGLRSAPRVDRAEKKSGPPGATLPPSPRHEQTPLVRTPEQNAEQETLTRLVRQCIGGDQQAWCDLVSHQHRRVYAICYRFTGGKGDAEDLTQEVFLKVYRNLLSFDAARGSFTTWITTMTRNLLVDHFRRTRLERVTDSIHAGADAETDGPSLEDQLRDPGPSQFDHVAGIELRVRIQTALQQISPELREAVIFRDLQDMDYKEIAEVLRIPEGTVKSRISRGRAELARLFGRTEGQVV